MRLYIVGAGFIARQHARGVTPLPQAPTELHVCDSNPDTLVSFQKEYPSFKTWPTMEAMLQAPADEKDIVVIATPPIPHAALAEKAMLSGRHVLVEKPLAMSEGELRNLQEVSRRTGRRFAECSVRFIDTPAFRRAASLLGSGAIGRPKSLRWIHRSRRTRAGVEYQPGSSWFLDRSEAGGGTLLDWGPYDLCAVFQLLHPRAFEVRTAWTAQFVNGMEPVGATYDIETQASAACLLELEDGSRIPLTYERTSAIYGREDSIAEIEGEKGAVRFDWLGWIDGGALVWSKDEGGKAVDQVESFGAGDLDFQFKPLHYFVKALQGQENPGFEGGRACYIHACVLAIARAAATGQPQRVARREWETV
jgi:predicted dehydrogenase